MKLLLVWIKSESKDERRNKYYEQKVKFTYIINEDVMISEAAVRL